MIRGMTSWARLPLRAGGVGTVVFAWAAVAWWGCGSGSATSVSGSDASRDDNSNGGAQGGGDTEGGARALDAGSVAESDFCTEVAAGLCGQLLPCCDSLGAGSDPATCRSQVNAVCARQLTRPDVVYDPVAAAACVAFYQNRTGNLTVQSCAIVHPATSNPCSRVFIGTLPPAAACSTDAGPDIQCAPSDAGLAACRAPDGRPHCVVVPYVDQGQACDNLTTACGPPLLCSPQSHTCVLPQPIGASCSDTAGCASFNCVDSGCADVAPIVVDVEFCGHYAITTDSG